MLQSHDRILCYLLCSLDYKPLQVFIRYTSGILQVYILHCLELHYSAYYMDTPWVGDGHKVGEGVGVGFCVGVGVCASGALSAALSAAPTAEVEANDTW